MPNLTLIKDTLMLLRLNRNDMSSLNFTELFQTYPRLDRLEMDVCEIATWPDFSGAHKLKHVYLQSNKFTSYPANPGFPANSILQTLNIHNNMVDNTLSSISSFFENLPHLRYLEMNNVGLTTWPHVSGYISRLIVFHVAGNKLNGFDFNRLLGVDSVSSPHLPPEGHRSLTNWNINSINLDYFPEEMFTIFPKLSQLRMGGNGQMTNVPNFTLAQSTLVRLEMHSNGIGANSPYPSFNYETVFHNMVKLRDIIMHNNFIRRFPFSAEFILTHLPVLEELNVKKNLLSTVPDLTAVGDASHYDDLLVSFVYFLGALVQWFHVRLLCG